MVSIDFTIVTMSLEAYSRFMEFGARIHGVKHCYGGTIAADSDKKVFDAYMDGDMEKSEYENLKTLIRNLDILVMEDNSIECDWIEA